MNYEMHDDMVQTYLDFVCERHRIWEKRQQPLSAQPWTQDPVLRSRKFTNVFRVLDHGSQFLVQELLYREEDLRFEDALMRCFLYRYSNIPEPWIHFHKDAGGRYPVCEDLRSILPMAWHGYRELGEPMFGVAFKMFVGAENKGTDRLTWILNLTERYFSPYSPDNIVEEFRKAKNIQERAAVLQTIPRCAGFMSMQIVTDIGYSPWMNQDENSYVIPGPGCKRGAAHVTTAPADVAVQYMWNAIRNRVDCPSLYGRQPSLMDIQNTLCEFQKYLRYMNDARPRSDYRPKHPGPQLEPFIPPHWRGTGNV